MSIIRLKDRHARFRTLVSFLFPITKPVKFQITSCSLFSFSKHFQRNYISLNKTEILVALFEVHPVGVLKNLNVASRRFNYLSKKGLYYELIIFYEGVNKKNFKTEKL